MCTAETPQARHTAMHSRPFLHTRLEQQTIQHMKQKPGCAKRRVGSGEPVQAERQRPRKTAAIVRRRGTCRSDNPKWGAATRRVRPNDLSFSLRRHGGTGFGTTWEANAMELVWVLALSCFRLGAQNRRRLKRGPESRSAPGCRVAS